jgi:hypothetical protein
MVISYPTRPTGFRPSEWVHALFDPELPFVSFVVYLPVMGVAKGHGPLIPILESSSSMFDVH